MGLSSPFQDVKGYSTGRPPMVIFVMCLLIFACATLAMAFYIQFADLILNTEIRATWKTFLSRLDSFNLCTYVEDKSSEESVNSISQFIDGGTYNNSDNGMISMTVAASVFLLREYRKFPTGMVAVTGRIDIDGIFAERDVSSTSLNITFVIPRNLSETSFKDTCVILLGPSWLLPLSRRSNVCVPSSVNRTITHVGELVQSKMNDSTVQCRNGSSIRLSYNNQSDDEFYLSREERWNIYIRLIHSSYFLFIVAVTFMCYSFIRGRFHPSFTKVDKVPLTL